MLNEQRILEVSVKFKGALFFMRQCRDAYSQYPAFHAILDLVDKCAYPGGRTEEQKVKKLRANCYAIMAISDIFSRGIPIFSLIDELCKPLVDEVLTDEQDEAEAMYGNSQEKGQRHYDASKYCERCHCVEGTNTDCPECCANLPEPVPNGEHVGFTVSVTENKEPLVMRIMCPRCNVTPLEGNECKKCGVVFPQSNLNLLKEL